MRKSGHARVAGKPGSQGNRLRALAELGLFAVFLSVHDDAMFLQLSL